MKQVLSILPILYFLSYVPLGMIFPYLVIDLEANEVSNIGILLTLPSLMMMVSGPLWGMLADWWQRSVQVLQMATLLAVVGLSVLVYGGASWAFFGMALYSLGWAPVASLIDALTMENLRVQGLQEGQSVNDRYGRIRLWGSVGYMGGVLLVGWLATQSTGWGLLGGLISTVIFAVGLSVLPSANVSVSRPSFVEIRKLLASNELMWLFLCSAIHFSVHIASSNFIVVHIYSLGMTDWVASIALALGVCVEIVVMYQGAHRLKGFSPHRLFQFSCVLAILRWFLMAVATTSAIVIFAQALHGVTFGLFWLSAVQLVKAQTPPELSSTGQSLLGTAVGGIGAVVGVYGASWIVEHWDTTTFYWCAVFVAGSASLLSLRLKWTKI